jgi:hypothetical protein
VCLIDVCKFNTLEHLIFLPRLVPVCVVCVFVVCVGGEKQGETQECEEPVGAYEKSVLLSTKSRSCLRAVEVH